MLSEKSQFLAHSLWRAFFLLGLLAVGHGHEDSKCKTRRCLAEKLTTDSFMSQPQDEYCFHSISVPLIEYRTLSVDTKNLRLFSRLQATLVWTDPAMVWDTADYPYDQVVLPVDKVWTPELHVTNGITTTMKHSSRDLVLNSNGTLRHTVIINAEVNCEVNLFNYPFASDSCPVAIQTWASNGCGTELLLNELKVVNGTQGDWQTESAVLITQYNMMTDRNYILVSLRIKYLNPFITLLLPTFLIILADVTSFALPLGGGERNSFKVTLVLSFTMFLIILNDQLPGDSKCSPIIRTHFCVCLVFLMLSMLVSIVLTRLAKDGSLILCCWSKGKESVPENTATVEEKEDEEAKTDIGVIQPTASEESNRMLRKVVDIVEALNAKELESERYHRFASAVDKFFFWFYVIFGSAYFLGMLYVMVNYRCEVNHFDFWY